MQNCWNNTPWKFHFSISNTTFAGPGIYTTLFFLFSQFSRLFFVVPVSICQSLFLYDLNHAISPRSPRSASLYPLIIQCFSLHGHILINFRLFCLQQFFCTLSNFDFFIRDSFGHDALLHCFVNGCFCIILNSMLRSLCRVWLETYQGALAIMQRVFDLQIISIGLLQPQNSIPYVQIGLSIVLYLRILVSSDS